MASVSRLFVLYLVMMVLVLQMYVEPAEIGASTAVGLSRNRMNRNLLQNIDCKVACGGRCKEASLHDRCLRACGTCCAKCNCVPPGTYGNKNLCPCYADMKTHGNKLKCP
uniref:Uncharacterized protein n=1 Tax=Picea sitchensis TaxID=3332 RepID=D5AE82_PICSI|nr:unknown [Picea sitchensis]